MGEVYRAFDTRLHREVAIKILPDVTNHRIYGTSGIVRLAYDVRPAPE